MDYLKSAYLRLSTLNCAHLLVLALVLKALISDISYATFLLTLPVLGFESYKLYLKSKKQEPIILDAEVRKELDLIKAKVNAGTLERNIAPAPSASKRYF